MDSRLPFWCLSVLLLGCNASDDSEPAAVQGASPPSTQVQAQRAGSPGVEAAAMAVQAVVVAARGGGAAPSSAARDPGVRSAPAGGGAPLAGLSTLELAAFEVGKQDFIEAETPEEGLGPTMNLDSCAGCHMQPAIGGSSPPVNPQIAFAAQASATNSVPPFLSLDGPVREARFVRNADGSADGGVHALFTVAGRSDAPDCTIRQPDFRRELARNNVVFRIPTPVFGAGLIEQIPDAEILANLSRNGDEKRTLGIRGRGNFVPAFQTISAQPNKNGNDGTLGRFGWKAQNKSLLLFSGEAYNVEMGITNDLFPTEREETAACNYLGTPNSATDFTAATPLVGLSSIDKFAVFMRLLAPPVPSTSQPGGSASIASGRALFASTGCALCHTPALRTGNASVTALRNQPVDLYSDLLLHDMGTALADGVSQGGAGPREFRTAPLWGLGQRLFFLHDGRTNDLRQALLAHQSAGSEANGVITRYTRLPDAQQQDLLNFLRSL